MILGGTFILVLGVTLVGLLIVAIFDIDVTPILRNMGVTLARHQVVDFFSIYPTQQRVEIVYYEDTDGDEEKEWVVFYQFDLTNVGSPYAGTVYDYDRGNPPVVFPYQLAPPDRNYLSEGVARLELVDVVTVGEVEEEPELMVYGQMPTPEQEQRDTEFTFDTDLNIFRNIPNSFPWEFPRDDPRRYQVIGTFRGDGGVAFDSKTKTVTVINREDFDRSQLSVQTVYALDENRGTYMSVTNPEQLSAPIASTVSFAYGMPSDVLDTPYPEKLVLGFYEMLAAKEPMVPPRDFLTGQALIEFDNNNLSYFGFGNASGTMTSVDAVTVTQLSYAPQTEQIGASTTVLGEEPNFQTASVAFQAEVGKTDTSTPTPIVWAITVVNGKWKMNQRLQ
jgi:hypothetical protein